jgi:hypothetical protein
MDVILAAYTLEKARVALDFCDRLMPVLGDGRRLVVLNEPQLRGGFAELVARPADRRWQLVDGSNCFGEFSAWQEGLDELGRHRVGGVLFVNDTVVAHRRFSVFRRWSLLRELACAPPRGVVGFVDHANNDIGDLRIAGMVLPGWVSSFLFWLGDQTLQLLDHRLWDAEAVESCVNGGTDEATFFSERLSPDLRRHVCEWLFHGGWYHSEALAATNAERFARKARIICAELMLSARCWALGCARHDPFERHPLARALDRRTERWIRTAGLSTALWTRHPQHWERRSRRESAGMKAG